MWSPLDTIATKKTLAKGINTMETILTGLGMNVTITVPTRAIFFPNSNVSRR